VYNYIGQSLNIPREAMHW